MAGTFSKYETDDLHHEHDDDLHRSTWQKSYDIKVEIG